MVLTSFSDANILNIFSGGSLLPGHTVYTLERIKYLRVPKDLALKIYDVNNAVNF